MTQIPSTFWSAEQDTHNDTAHILFAWLEFFVIDRENNNSNKFMGIRQKPENEGEKNHHAIIAASECSRGQRTKLQWTCFFSVGYIFFSRKYMYMFSVFSMSPRDSYPKKKLNSSISIS